jgi:TatD DNase family protein
MFINIHTHRKSDSNFFLLNNGFQECSEFDFSAGIHPWEMNPTEHFLDLEKSAQNQRCMAMGECGLDKFKGPDISIQMDSLTHQMGLAIQYDLPVIIHCVRSFSELIKTCKPYINKTPIIIHGFTKATLLEDLIQQGFYLSFGHALMKNQKLMDAFKKTPNDRIFLETDETDISIKELYRFGAQLKELPLEDFIEIILNNTKSVFKKWQIG